MADEISIIGFGVDTGPIDRGAAALDNLASKGAGVDRALAQVDQAVSRTGKSLDTLGKGAESATTLGEVAQGAEAAARGIGEVGEASERGAQGMRKYGESLREVVNAAKQSATQSGAIFDAQKIEQAAQAGRSHAEAIAESTVNMRGASSEASRLNDTIRRQSRELSTAEGLLKRYAYQLGAALSVGRLLSAADEWGQLTSRLQIATGGIDSAGDAMGRLMQVANRTYQPVAEVSELFIRTSDTMREMGYNSEATLGMVEALSYGLTVSAASGQKASSVIDAWSKSILRGRVDMEAFNTIISYAPRLQKALADSLGTTNAGLMQMVMAGELTAEKLLKVADQAQKMGEEADLMPVTMRDAFVKLTNSVTQWSGQMNDGVGITSALTGAMGLLADNIGAVIAAAGTLVALKVASWMGAVHAGTVLATGGFTALAASVRATLVAMGPVGWIITGLGAAFTAYELFGKKAREAGDDTEAGMHKAATGTAVNATRIRAELNKLIEKYGDLARARGVALSTTTFAGETASPYDAAKAEIARLEAYRRAHESRTFADGIPIATGAVNERIDVGGGVSMTRGTLEKQIADLKNYVSERDAALRQIQQNSFADFIADPRGMTEAQRRAAQAKKIVEEYNNAILGETDPERIAMAARARDRMLASLTKSIGPEKLSEAQQMIASLQRQVEMIGLVGQEEIALADIQAGRMKTWSEAERQSFVALSREADMRNLVKKATEEDAERQKERLSAARQQTKSVEESIQSLRTEAQARELAATAGIGLAEATERLAAARAEEAFWKAAEAGEGQEMLDALAKEARLRKDLSELIGQQATEESARRAAQEAINEWKRASEDINRTLTDALMRGFESGKGFARNLRDAIVNLFQTMVLRPIVQPVVSGMLGMAGMSAAGSATASTAGSLVNAGGLLGGIAGSAGVFGSSFMYGLSRWGAGNVAGLLGMGPSALFSGGMASGLGTIAGALAPIAIGVAAIMSLVSKGETRSGGRYGLIDGQAAYLEGPSGGEIGEITTAVQSTVDVINDTLRAVGSEAAIAGFAAGLETSAKGRGGAFAGGSLTTGETFGDAQDAIAWQYTESLKAEEAGARFARELQEAALQAFQAAVMPEMIERQLKGVNVTALADADLTALYESIITTVSGVNALRESLKYLPMGELAALSFDAAASLAEFAGGLDALQSNLTTYYQEFFTAEERAAATTAELTSRLGELGFALPATRDGFRELVESISAAADPQTLASLLQLAPAFASITESADELAQQAEESARAIADAAAQIARERHDLETRLLQAQGDTAALRARELAAIDASNRALLEQIFALEDAQAAAEAATRAQAELAAAQEAAQRAAREATDAAFSSLQRSISAQIESANAARAVAQEQVRSVKSVFDTLTGAINSLIDELPGSSVAGNAFIVQAIETALRTGYLPDAQDLGRAIASAREGLGSENYGSAFEQERDRMLLANRLSQLRELSGDQLDSAEQHLRAAESQIEYLRSLQQSARDQIDAARGIDVSVRSVEDALERLTLALLGETSTGSVASTTPAYTPGVQDNSAPVSSTPVSHAWYTPGSLQAGYTLEQLESSARLIYPGGKGYYQAHGTDAHDELIRLFGLIQDWQNPGQWIRTRAQGGYTPPGWTLVGEQGPELRFSGSASMIYSADRTARMLSGGDMTAEIRALREDSRAQARALVQLQSRMARVLERWDGDGMPVERVES